MAVLSNAQVDNYNQIAALDAALPNGQVEWWRSGGEADDAAEPPMPDRHFDGDSDSEEAKTSTTAGSAAGVPPGGASSASSGSKRPRRAVANYTQPG